VSLEAITWAFKQPVPNSSAKFVLVALANRANPDQKGRVIAWPSIDYIANVTSQNRKTVITNLAKLREWKLIDDTGDRVGRTGQIPVYELKVPGDLFTEQAQKRNSSRTGTVPKTVRKSPVFSSKQSQKRDTDSFKDSSLIQSRDEKAAERKARCRTAEANGLTAVKELLKGMAP
jgi:pyocin large subunit-like protein